MEDNIEVAASEAAEDTTVHGLTSEEFNQLSDMDQKDLPTAVKQGWNKNKPKDDPDYVGPHDFVVRGPLMDQIKQLQHGVEKLNKLSEDASRRAKEAEVAAFRRYEQELMQLRQQAISEGNEQAIDAISQDLYRTKASEEAAIRDLQAPPNQEVIEFLEKHRNVWFNNNSPLNESMSMFAIARENAIKAANPQLPLRDILKQVEKDVVSNFPEVFPHKSKAAPLGGGHATSLGEDSATSINDLPPEGRQVYKMIAALKKKAGEKYSVKQFTDTYNTYAKKGK